MKYFFSYLLQNPLIRLTAFWLVIGFLGIVVFAWRVGTMRVELNDLNAKIQSHIIALNIIDENKAAKNQEELQNIIRQIEKYRPSVPELLGFVESIELLLKKRTLDFSLSSIKTDVVVDDTKKETVSYQIMARTSALELREVIKDMENSPYATEIKDFQVTKNDDSSYDLDLNFILYTKLK